MCQVFKRKINPYFFRQEEACPSVCGRRCRRRTRACNGPYQLACVGQGKGEEFDDCPALNDQGNISINTTELITRYYLKNQSKNPLFIKKFPGI